MAFFERDTLFAGHIGRVAEVYEVVAHHRALEVSTPDLPRPSTGETSVTSPL